jgi:hypothetical protein
MHFTLPSFALAIQRGTMAAAAAVVLLAGCGGAFGTDGGFGADADRTLATKRNANKQASPPPPDLIGSELAWSDPRAWGGMLPPAGAEVVIPAGKVVVLDVSPPPLAGLRIEGTLRFARRDLQLVAGSIDVTGALEIGSVDQPFAQKAVITLNGAPPAVNNGVARGLNVRGGRLQIVGASPEPGWTKINEHASAGTTRLTLKDTTNWRAGDTVAIAPTDFYGVASTERMTLAAASSNQIDLKTALSKFRWGRLQYVGNGGMSLTPDPAYAPPASPAPRELDERAAVANLTRNVVIEGADDEVWRASGFGAHIMIMGLASKIHVDGVEIRRAGQAGTLARYPFHWHLLSYAGNGQLMGDAVGHVLKNSAIWNSSQRCIVVHATNGVQVVNNVCHDVKGHAVFLEDAVERRNVIEGNLVLMTRMPPDAQRLSAHEGAVFEGGSSGFWLTNPDNVVRNNHAGDVHGNGFWMAFPEKPLGDSKAVAIVPNNVPLGVFERNTAHSAREPGLLLEHAPFDDAGNVRPTNYRPKNPDGSPSKHTLSEITTFKNTGGAYRNRAGGISYSQWISADNVGTHMAGSSDTGTISNGLFVGYSLNHLSGYPITWHNSKPAAFATYNSSIDMRDNTIVNFPFVDGATSGAFSTSDYYIAGVNKGTARNPNNRLIAANAGYRTLPPHLDGKPIDRRFWTLSGALWDPHGYWGAKGQYWVYDLPFLTAGANCQWVEPAGKNGKSCDGEYYGIGRFKTDFDPSEYQFVSAIEATRIDAAGNTIGTWAVQDGTNSTMLGWMRHFAARQGGNYILRFPGKPAPRYVAMGISNAFRASDSFVIAIAFDGSATPSGYTLAGREFNRDDPKIDSAFWASSPSIRWFKPAASLQAIAASEGDLMWQDKANNLVWIKFKGGMPYMASGPNSADSNEDLYRTFSVVLYQK